MTTILPEDRNKINILAGYVHKEGVSLENSPRYAKFIFFYNLPLFNQLLENPNLLRVGIARALLIAFKKGDEYYYVGEDYHRLTVLYMVDSSNFGKKRLRDQYTKHGMAESVDRVDRLIRSLLEKQLEETTFSRTIPLPTDVERFEQNYWFLEGINVGILMFKGDPRGKRNWGLMEVGGPDSRLIVYGRTKEEIEDMAKDAIMDLSKMNGNAKIKSEKMQVIQGMIPNDPASGSDMRKKWFQLSLIRDTEGGYRVIYTPFVGLTKETGPLNKNDAEKIFHSYTSIRNLENTFRTYKTVTRKAS